MLKINSPFIKMYEIDRNTLYIQLFKGSEIPSSWKPTDVIDHSKVTLVLFTESLATKFTRFFLVYDGKMQTTGGGGSCYNPKNPEAKTRTYITESIGTYWSRDRIFDVQYIFMMIASIKYDLMLEATGRKDQSIFFSHIKEVREGMYGILAVKIDMMGMGRIDIILEANTDFRRNPLLLTN